MRTLAEYGLRLVRRPGDGACLYWSLGTGIGVYSRTSFNLFNNGAEDESPIFNEDVPASSGLLKQMRAAALTAAPLLPRPSPPPSPPLSSPLLSPAPPSAGRGSETVATALSWRGGGPVSGRRMMGDGAR